MLFYYYAALFGVGVVSVFANQKYARSTRNYYEIFVFALITGIMGCSVFAVSSGFKLSFTAMTAVYSAFYAVAALISYFTTIPLYRYMGIAEAGVCKSSISLVVTAISGYVLFSEKVTLLSLIRIALMLGATFAVYYNTKTDKSLPSGNKTRLIGIVLCIIAAFGGVIATVTSKAFANDTRVTDTNSFFFLTNVIIVVFSALVVLILNISSRKREKSDRIKPWQYGMIFVTTIMSNISSVISVLILESGDVSLYAPLSGALNLVSAQTVSVFYREKIKPLPLILAIFAVILGIFE